MFNIFLDDLPRKYNGYSINPSFRTGMMITQLLNDPECSEWERYTLASELLFCDLPNNIQECLEGITWFLGGWNLDNPEKGKKNDVIIMDYDIDQWRIHSAFIKQYHIDLSTCDIHYWEFMGLLSNLEECSFTRVMEIRAKEETADMKPDAKKALRKAKAIYNIRRNKIEDDQTSPEREEFLRIAGIK